MKSKVTKWIAVVGLAAIILAGLGFAQKRKYDRQRAEWKTTTLIRLATTSVTNELHRLNASAGVREHREWIGDDVLVMTNGEYLVYAFRHGFNNGFVDHLFLARGSDGSWRYSTYHFCNGLVGVLTDDPPGSIKEFAERYSVREFDGKSEECLKRTWPLKATK